MVNHGHININGSRNSIPSFQGFWRKNEDIQLSIMAFFW
jgi:ribosomal protein S4